MHGCSYDFELAKWSIANFRKCYPSCRLILMVDENNSRWDCLRDVADLRYTENFHAPITRGATVWIERFRIFFENPTRYLVKFDSDTGWYRRLDKPFPPPNVPVTFGQICSHADVSYPHGGFIGLSVAAAWKAFLDPATRGLSNPESWCPSAILPGPWRRYHRLGIVCEDMVWGNVCRKLKIPVVHYGDVRTRGLKHKSNPDLRWAVTHPCKDARL